MEEEERKLSYKLVTGRLLLLKNQPCSEGRCERRYKEQSEQSTTFTISTCLSIPKNDMGDY